MAKKNKSVFNYTHDEIDAYNKGWAKFMVDIFKEQIDRLKISDSGALESSLKEYASTGTVTTIEHRFLMYGLYVAAGVGKGFTKGNGGDLEFMAWRAREGQVGAGLSQHHMLSPKYERKTVTRGKNKGMEAALTSGQHRKRRDWVIKKYWYSMKRLNETNNAFWGQAYHGMQTSFLDELFHGLTAK